MLEWRKVGGIAALIEAATFVFGFAMAVTVLSDYTTGDPAPAESVAFLVDNEAALSAWYLVIFIVFGVVLVPLVLAMRELLRSRSAMLVQAATAFGLIWAGLVLAAGMVAMIGLGTVADLHETSAARAEPVWSALDSVQNALGGGNEIVGGLWVLLVSSVAVQTQALPRGLCYLGVVAGAAGIVTVVPALEAVGAIFGLGLIAWFAWLGIVMRRPAHPQPRRGERSRSRHAERHAS